MDLARQADLESMQNKMQSRCSCPFWCPRASYYGPMRQRISPNWVVLLELDALERISHISLCRFQQILLQLSAQLFSMMPLLSSELSFPDTHLRKRAQILGAKLRSPSLRISGDSTSGILTKIASTNKINI